MFPSSCWIAISLPGWAWLLANLAAHARPSTGSSPIISVPHRPVSRRWRARLKPRRTRYSILAVDPGSLLFTFVRAEPHSGLAQESDFEVREVVQQRRVESSVPFVQVKSPKTVVSGELEVGPESIGAQPLFHPGAKSRRCGHTLSSNRASRGVDYVRGTSILRRQVMHGWSRHS